MDAFQIITTIIVIALIGISITLFILHSNLRSNTKSEHKKIRDENKMSLTQQEEILNSHSTQLNDTRYNIDKVRKASTTNSIGVGVAYSKMQKANQTLEQKILDLSNSTTDDINAIDKKLKESIGESGTETSGLTEKLEALNTSLNKFKSDLQNMQNNGDMKNLRIEANGVVMIGNIPLKEYITKVIDENVENNNNTDTFIERFTEHMSVNSMSGLVQNTIQNTSGLVDVSKKIEETDNKVTSASNEVNILKRDIDGDKKNTSVELRHHQTQIDDLKKLFNEQYETLSRNMFELALKIGVQNEGLTEEQKKEIDTQYKKTLQSFKAMRATKTMMNKGVTSKTMKTGSMSVSNDLTLKGGTHASIMNPDGATKISSHGIMFGGANNKREVNSAQISAGIHHPDSLNIVGMSDKKGNNRKIDMWAEGGLNIRGKTSINGDTVVGNTLRVKADITGKKEHVMPRGWGGGVHTWDVYANATIGAGRNGKVNAYINSNGEVRGKNINAENKVCIGNTCINEKDVNSFKGTNSLKNGTNVNGKITTHSGVSVTKGNPGPLIEKRYNNNAANRYGISQENNGTVHLYAANAWEPSTLNLSYATGEGTYKPVLTAKKDKVEINGDTVVNGNIKGNTVNAGNKLCIGTLPNRVCIGALHLKNLMMGRTAHNHGNINHEWNKFKSSGQYKSFHASP